MPRNIPVIAPAMPVKIPSMMINANICVLETPMALIMPISFRRLTTEKVMVLYMMKAPTTNASNPKAERFTSKARVISVADKLRDSEEVTYIPLGNNS